MSIRKDLNTGTVFMYLKTFKVCDCIKPPVLSNLVLNNLLQDILVDTSYIKQIEKFNMGYSIVPANSITNVCHLVTYNNKNYIICCTNRFALT